MTIKTHTQLKSALLLLLAAVIWGSAFVAQSVGAELVPPFTFNAVRYIMGGAILAPLSILIRRFSREQAQRHEQKKSHKKAMIAGGLSCGFFLFGASALQQAAMATTSAGKAGFLTALYIIIVPLIGLLFKKRHGPLLWIAIIIALVGMYLLCIKEQFTINQGDLMVILCAVVYSGHIWVIDYFLPRVDPVMLAYAQFFAAGFMSLLVALVFEKTTVQALLDAWLPLIYTGVLSSAVAFTLQMVAQKYVGPTIAALVCSTESVFAALFGWIILGQVLLPKEMAGCVLVFAAIMLAQLPGKSKRKQEG